MLVQKVTVDAQLVSNKIEAMVKEGYELLNSYPDKQNPGKYILEFKPQEKGRVMLD